MFCISVAAQSTSKIMAWVHSGCSLRLEGSTRDLLLLRDLSSVRSGENNSLEPKNHLRKPKPILDTRSSCC